MCSTQTSVCVLTARGMAAISSISLAGPDAGAVLEKIFQRSANDSLPPSGYSPFAGGELKVLHGAIEDGVRVIDEVLVGCEGADTFVIHCHGNPLLVEQIVRLVQAHGAVLTDAESFAFSHYQQTSENLIEAEAKLAMQKSATVLGAKILQAQIDRGLLQWVTETLSVIDSLDAEDIKKQCVEILEHSIIAQRIINGVRIVIAGPPNSGKSTLLNCLAGQEQVIVTDTAGTTRDWVSVHAYLGEGTLRAEFIDTAGLDEALAGKDDIEQTAQAITKKLLESCDLILYVQDVTTVIRDPSSVIRTGVRVIYIDNKCDLVQELKNTGTQEYQFIPISAKHNEGIEGLVRELLHRLRVANFDATKPVAFTQRQRNLLLSIIKKDQSPKKTLSSLLHS